MLPLLNDPVFTADLTQCLDFYDKQQRNGTKKGFHIGNCKAPDLHSSANSINSPAAQKMKKKKIQSSSYLHSLDTQPDRMTQKNQ